MLFHISKPTYITDGDGKVYTSHTILVVDATEEQIREIKAYLELMTLDDSYDLVG